MSKQKFYKLAESAGIIVRGVEPAMTHPRSGEELPYLIPLDAPDGKLFKATGCHCDCGIQGFPPSGRGVNWGEAVGFLEELIEYGLEDCEDAECEMCHGEFAAESTTPA